MRIISHVVRRFLPIMVLRAYCELECWSPGAKLLAFLYSITCSSSYNSLTAYLFILIVKSEDANSAKKLLLNITNSAQFR